MSVITTLEWLACNILNAIRSNGTRANISVTMLNAIVSWTVSFIWACHIRDHAMKKYGHNLAAPIFDTFCYADDIHGCICRQCQTKYTISFVIACPSKAPTKTLLHIVKSHCLVRISILFATISRISATLICLLYLSPGLREFWRSRKAKAHY